MKKLFSKIFAKIKKDPMDIRAYKDAFDLCVLSEEKDFALSHSSNEKLRKLISKAMSKGQCVTEMFELYKKSLLFDAQCSFDAFLLYLEIDRKPEERFYQPRRKVLKQVGEKLTSYKGIWGIVKKIMMWLLVAVGSIVDYILLTMGQTLHLNVSVGSAVALIVIFWLMANELISILENIDEVGVPLPPFLMKLVSLIKEKVEDTSKIEAGKTEPHKLE